MIFNDMLKKEAIEIVTSMSVLPKDRVRQNRIIMRLDDRHEIEKHVVN